MNTFESFKKYDVSAKPIIKKSDCIERMIEMAWQDRTPFEAIEKEFELTENQLKNRMRDHLSPKSYRRWRKRVQGRATKHHGKSAITITRFQGPW